MMKVVVKNTIKFPSNLIMQNDLMTIAQKIVIPLLQDGIDRSVGVDGAPLPVAADSTTKLKGKDIQKRIYTKKGDIRGSAIKAIGQTGLKSFTSRPLVRTGKLRKSFFAKPKDKSTIIVSLSDDRYKIGGYLQIDGITSNQYGNRKYMFFGITDGMEASSMDYMKAKIKEKINKFNGR